MQTVRITRATWYQSYGRLHQPILAMLLEGANKQAVEKLRCFWYIGPVTNLVRVCTWVISFDVKEYYRHRDWTERMFLKGH
ncbi:MAG: hypothetical protein ACYTEX_00345 [Planctomycetota bacterium]